jgi:ADP-dependent NAD(P)H-hydrate dehydratase / NAD(P)H-hydrate epimerase
MRLPTRLLRRNPRGHKGDYGHIFIVAGSARYSGAAALCAQAALRSGAGLVTVGIPQGINNAFIRIKAREVMTLPLAETAAGNLSGRAFEKIRDFARGCDVVVVGPGLGQEPSTQTFIRRLASSLGGLCVIDADGLNALAGHLAILDKATAQIIITPHPGEMARLTGRKVGVSRKERIACACSFARKHTVTVVLKGHGTVVAAPDGRKYVNTTGNPGMATAGSGDVLTGMIAALLGQGSGCFEAAKFAVYLHGLAGDLAAREKTQMGMIASDIIAMVPRAIKRSSSMCRRSSVGRAAVL